MIENFKGQPRRFLIGTDIGVWSCEIDKICQHRLFSFLHCFSKYVSFSRSTASKFMDYDPKKSLITSLMDVAMILPFFYITLQNFDWF